MQAKLIAAEERIAVGVDKTNDLRLEVRTQFARWTSAALLIGIVVQTCAVIVTTKMLEKVFSHERLPAQTVQK